MAAPCARPPGLCLALIRVAADLPAARPVGALPLGHLLPPDGLLTTCLPPPAGSNRRALVAGAPGCRGNTRTSRHSSHGSGFGGGCPCWCRWAPPLAAALFLLAGGFSAVLRSCCAVAWPRWRLISIRRALIMAEVRGQPGSASVRLGEVCERAPRGERAGRRGRSGAAAGTTKRPAVLQT